MKNKLTLAEVAKMAGVTPATVSRALNPATVHLISEATARRIRELSDRLGFRPSLSARETATGRTYKIGMILNNMEQDMCSHDWNRITCAVSSNLQALGYSLLLLRTSGMNTPMDVQVSRFLMSGVADAYITSPSMIENNTREVLATLKAPLAVICEPGISAQVNSGVRRSNHEAFRQVWQRLPREFHGRFAFFSPNTEEARLMLDEIQKVAWELDINGKQAIRHVTLQRHSKAPVMEYAEAYHQTKEKMNILKDFDVIWCPSDFFAMGVKDALEENGRQIGKDAWLLGYGDLESFPEMSQQPELSTISANSLLIAKELCNNLIRQLNGESPRCSVVEATFVSRKTFF